MSLASLPAQAPAAPVAAAATAVPKLATAKLLRELVLYGLVSAVSLAVDVAVLIGLTELAGLHYLASAAIAFTTGALVAYTLSVAFVFRERRLEDRRSELVLFVLLGLGGLALNEAVLWGSVHWLGLGYAIAKAPAAVASFSFNFIARRALLFTATR